MDVEFVYDTKNKRHSVDMTGEHALVAQFLNAEVEVAQKDPSAILALLQTLESREQTLLPFVEWTMEVEDDDLRILHNALYQSNHEHSDFAPSSADWQLSVECGKQDMIDLLTSWAEFVRYE